MFYQLSYDKCLNADPFFLEESKEWVIGASIELKFSHVFNDDKVLNKNYEQTVQLENIRTNLPNLVKVSYDNKRKSFLFSEHQEIKGKYEVIGYTKHIIECKESTSAVPTNITKLEFDSMIEKYGNYFHTDSNLQTLSYSRYELTSIDTETIVENTKDEYSNELIDTLESKLILVKEKHEKVLSNRNPVSMKAEYRKRCLQFLNDIDYLSNQKDFFLNYETYEQDSILNSYVLLINEWEKFTKFVEKNSTFLY